MKFLIVNIIWKLWSSRAYAPTRIIWSCGTHPVGIIKFDISIFFNHFAMKFLIVFIFFFCLYSVLFFVWRCKDMARIGGSQYIIVFFISFVATSSLVYDKPWKGPRFLSQNPLLWLRRSEIWAHEKEPPHSHSPSQFWSWFFLDGLLSYKYIR